MEVDSWGHLELYMCDFPASRAATIDTRASFRYTCFLITYLILPDYDDDEGGGDDDDDDDD